MWEQKSINSNYRQLGCNLWVTLFALETYLMGPTIKVQGPKRLCFQISAVDSSYILRYFKKKIQTIGSTFLDFCGPLLKNLNRSISSKGLKRPCGQIWKPDPSQIFKKGGKT
eukprot:TRINITY_DN7653_c0_g2_i1.p1 TRINITY_DN7653_c0_g2~~TRINITY_DN7653_c0_g2_i1.p1  ORF type:complete len:112 (+),score=3.50 TRINITY_DN7653_c0_g2_i1:334-669(+)